MTQIIISKVLLFFPSLITSKGLKCSLFEITTQFLMLNLITVGVSWYFVKGLVMVALLRFLNPLKKLGSPYFHGYSFDNISNQLI